jgi:hypothetical protein
MKHFLLAATAIAALMVSTPLWAQVGSTTPSTTPQSQDVPYQIPATPTPETPAHVQSMNRMHAGGKVTSERGRRIPIHRRHHEIQSASRAPSRTAHGTNPTTPNRMSVGGKVTSGSSRN